MKKTGGLYQSVAVVVFNTLLLGCLVVFLYPHAKNLFKGGPEAPVRKSLMDFAESNHIYPHLTSEESRQLIAESWGHPYRYLSYSGYGEKPRQGKWVNVDTAGFRYSVPQGPWPPDSTALNVFLFGGSTMFGYGVADKETIGSYLQAQLREKSLETQEVHVYNFGQGAYLSIQERALFARLLQQGLAPGLAVFMDGLNDLNADTFEPAVSFTEKEYRGYTSVNWRTWLNSMELVKDLRSLFLKDREKVKPSPPVSHIDYASMRRAIALETGTDTLALLNFDLNKKYSTDDSLMIINSVNHLLRNSLLLEGLAEAAGIPVLKVLQPLPSIRYDLKYFAPELNTNMLRKHNAAYPVLSRLGESGKLGKHFLDLSGIQDSLNQPLYVDGLHYNRELNEIIAKEITSRISVSEKGFRLEP